ncbi:hypothetical protein [Weissella paramesenteroides]|uniref:hypothetical protein n=1 Tax=Weissella paramesenteroides TaxID=1249 RepID=UPI003D3632BE
MTNKAYIVANKQQEREVLHELEKNGNEWNDKRNATDFIPSEKSYVKFPYAIMSDRFIGWLSIDDAIVENYEIVYDGRKEEQMSEKYVVSQEFMNELKEWKKRGNTEVYFVGSYDLSMLPDYVKRWWNYPEINNFECNNRLIAIIRWVNGEDVFEIEKPKKWVIRSKDRTEQGSYLYVMLDISHGVKKTISFWDKDVATRFDTKEEAQSWANGHQEVVQVEVD